ncbi:MAG TPA: 50S ribosomal protein L19, partial [Planctomycetaceae bacterium]|nr:50S ribosomal protein L19 [Planctomycetaceae bacterium]
PKPREENLFDDEAEETPADTAAADASAAVPRTAEPAATPDAPAES